MITIWVVLLVMAECHTSALATKENGVKKRSGTSYKVEGCFSSFVDSGSPISMGKRSSNVRCQDTCKEKGYVLAATKGSQCHCGNIYPKGKKVSDDQCTTRCRSYLSCGSPQSCCGGPNAYSVSVVGNIDVPKQILRRLIHVWQSNTDYRDVMKRLVTVKEPGSHEANWESSMDRQGWSECGKGRYITGMWRHDYKSGDERIGRIESAKCYDAPKYLFSSEQDQSCYNHDVWRSFNSKGWSTCKKGYYMSGMYRTSGHKLYNIEEFRCCRPKSQEEQWGDCYNHNAWHSFDKRGWTECKSGYYLAGLYRNNCERLGCIEEFKCCKMGKYNGQSFIEKPDFVINVKDTSGQLKQCSMNAMDKTATSTTFSCKALSNRKNMMKLDAVSFNIEDNTPLNVAQPKRVAGFSPVTCSAHSNKYTCKKSLTTTISKSSSFAVGSGFEMSVSIGASVEVGAEAFGASIATSFSTEISSSSSFNVERSSSKTTETADNTEVSIDVPAHTQIKIDLLRTVQDVEYKWKAAFKLLGKYSVKWNNGFETFEDVTTVLTGSDRVMYAFGTWKYPGTDMLHVVITDKYGKEEATGCEHATGKGENCKMTAPK